MAAPTRFLARLRRRAKAEDGFGLIELTIAMSVLAIGLFALFSAFTTGYIVLRRASIQGTASVLADKTMEKYRGMQYGAIALGTTTTSYSSTSNPSSPDGRAYTVTTTIASGTAPNTSGSSARAVKLVSVTVTDSSGKQWVSEQSTFDPLTGQ